MLEGNFMFLMTTNLINRIIVGSWPLPHLLLLFLNKGRRDTVPAGYCTVRCSLATHPSSCSCGKTVTPPVVGKEQEAVRGVALWCCGSAVDELQFLYG